MSLNGYALVTGAGMVPIYFLVCFLGNSNLRPSLINHLLPSSLPFPISTYHQAQSRLFRTHYPHFISHTFYIILLSLVSLCFL